MSAYLRQVTVNNLTKSYLHNDIKKAKYKLNDCFLFKVSLCCNLFPKHRSPMSLQPVKHHCMGCHTLHSCYGKCKACAMFLNGTKCRFLNIYCLLCLRHYLSVGITK